MSKRPKSKGLHKIAVIMGDGIGKEVVPEGMRVLDAVSEQFGFRIEWELFPWSCEYYAKKGEMMPANGLEILRGFEAIFLGAVGYPGVPDDVSIWGLLLPIRKGFQQYVNLRPVRMFKGIPCPLRDRRPEEIDFYVVRENNEGEYTSVGGAVYAGTEQETVIQQSVFTRKGVERVMRFAFELAMKRRRRLTSATKSNAMIYTMPFWDRIMKEVSREYPKVETNQVHVDALSALCVLHPERLDVIVASNLFGDILSDLGAAVAGSLGIAPSANLNPERDYPSMFEPVHGSAPDIAGKGIANPIGQILSGAMMLEHLGHLEAAMMVEAAVEKVLANGNLRTPDLGGKASTKALGEAIAHMVSR
ncbi:MAG: tartrate dehydrogenase [Thermodesulfobacteriota bacterium]